MNERAASQSWDPERYRKNASFVSELAGPVLELLAPVAGEHILDLGCGEGTLALYLESLGCTVVGVDSSAEQVADAREKGVDAHVADAAALDFETAFDAVFSNAVLHWVKQPDAVIAGVRRALKPGGRFVAEFGGHGNVGAIADALGQALVDRGYDAVAANPWYFPTPAEYQARLEEGGFRVESIGLHPRPTPLPGDIDGWLETFAESFLRAVPEAHRPGLVSDVAAKLEPALRRGDGVWVADYVRLRVAARLQGR